ncbi:MAG: hypothetical protein QW086_01325 [Pyrobaculum sp.]
MVSGIEPVESYRVFNMGMIVYTDRDNQEHALAPLEPLNPKPIGEVKERELAVVNGVYRGAVSAEHGIGIRRRSC